MGPTTTKKEAIHSEALELDHLYQTAPVGLCLLDRNLRYLRINELLAEFHGKPVSEHIGRPIREVLPAAGADLGAHAPTDPSRRAKPK